MYQAYHRYLADYCAPYPDRLTSLRAGLRRATRRRRSPRSVAGRRRRGRSGIFPICPPELSLDDPAWEPIWAAAQDHDLTVVIHSFTMTVPYPPGTWDTWENVFLQRAAGHVWNAQRNMAAHHRRRRPRSLSRAAPDLARVRPRLAGLLGLAPRRAGRDVASRAAGAQAASRASTSAGRSTSRASSSTRASCRCGRRSRRWATRR